MSYGTGLPAWAVRARAAERSRSGAGAGQVQGEGQSREGRPVRGKGQGESSREQGEQAAGPVRLRPAAPPGDQAGPPPLPLLPAQGRRAEEGHRGPSGRQPRPSAACAESPSLEASPLLAEQRRRRRLREGRWSRRTGGRGLRTDKGRRRPGGGGRSFRAVWRGPRPHEGGAGGARSPRPSDRGIRAPTLLHRR